MNSAQIAYPRIPEPKTQYLDNAYLNLSLAKQKFGNSNLVETAGRTINFDNAVVIDIACGAGSSTVQLAKSLPNAYVVGIDINPHAIALARNLNSSSPLPNLEFRVADCHDLSGSAAYITCLDSLHHFDRVDELLKRVFQSLEPGGVFFFADMDRDSLGCVSRVTHPNFVDRCYSAREKGEEHLLDFLVGRERSSIGAIDVRALTVISLMASYTKEEISDLIGNSGLMLIKIASEKIRYQGIAVKPDAD